MSRVLVVISPSAKDDLAEALAWWLENRSDAPLAVADDVAIAFAGLERDAAKAPIFARMPGFVVRRIHLPRTHRHLYFAIENDRVLVLSVWGSVRGVLPKLRARARETR